MYLTTYIQKSLIHSGIDELARQSDGLARQSEHIWIDLRLTSIVKWWVPIRILTIKLKKLNAYRHTYNTSYTTLTEINIRIVNPASRSRKLVMLTTKYYPQMCNTTTQLSNIITITFILHPHITTILYSYSRALLQFHSNVYIIIKYYAGGAKRGHAPHKYIIRRSSDHLRVLGRFRVHFASRLPGVSVANPHTIRAKKWFYKHGRRSIASANKVWISEGRFPGSRGSVEAVWASAEMKKKLWYFNSRLAVFSPRLTVSDVFRRFGTCAKMPGRIMFLSYCGEIR